ncbi:MAG: sprT domain-containing protein [Flavobacteriaceae bacterium]|nr:sprT domain-containing protein [Flavobacteriaceae bacterium]
MEIEIKKHVPQSALGLVLDLMRKHPFELKIKNQRKTKHGDFRTSNTKGYKISINNDLNHYRFLITLIHEIAHLVTHKKFGSTKPHGIYWKQTFKYLMLPFLSDDIFPSDILSPLAKYLINPKARTDADLNLSLALRNYDIKSDKKLIFELELGAIFVHNKRIFNRGSKRRSRYECTETRTQKKYLFQQNAEVVLIENNTDEE